jgi:uncharacterized membrane protein (DUF485 family)
MHAQINGRTCLRELLPSCARLICRPELHNKKRRASLSRPINFNFNYTRKIVACVDFILSRLDISPTRRECVSCQNRLSWKMTFTWVTIWFSFSSSNRFRFEMKFDPQNVTTILSAYAANTIVTAGAERRRLLLPPEPFLTKHFRDLRCKRSKFAWRLIQVVERERECVAQLAEMGRTRKRPS